MIQQQRKGLAVGPTLAGVVKMGPATFLRCAVQHGLLLFEYIACLATDLISAAIGIRLLQRRC